MAKYNCNNKGIEGTWWERQVSSFLVEHFNIIIEKATFNKDYKEGIDYYIPNIVPSLFNQKIMLTCNVKGQKRIQQPNGPKLVDEMWIEIGHRDLGPAKGWIYKDGVDLILQVIKDKIYAIKLLDLRDFSETHVSNKIVHSPFDALYTLYDREGDLISRIKIKDLPTNIYTIIQGPKMWATLK